MFSKNIMVSLALKAVLLAMYLPFFTVQDYYKFKAPVYGANHSNLSNQQNNKKNCGIGSSISKSAAKNFRLNKRFQPSSSFALIFPFSTGSANFSGSIITEDFIDADLIQNLYSDHLHRGPPIAASTQA